MTDLEQMRVERDFFSTELQKVKDENDRLQAAAGMAQYWRDQYDLVRAHLDRVQSALDTPYKKHPLTAVVDRAGLDVKRHEWSETPIKTP
jgi:hypothetical protein